MQQTLANAWKVQDIRKKILYTLMMLLVYRLCSVILVPGVDQARLAEIVANTGLLGIMDGINGGNLANATIFAMGITPYINASIIMQLLAVAIPALENLQKEGPEGRKKIAQYTRYVAVGLAFVQSFATIVGLNTVVDGNIFIYISIALVLTAGTALVMWIGERITENGIGNGVSLIIFINIASSLPVQVISLFQNIMIGEFNGWLLIPMVVGVVAMVAGIVFVDLGERRVPVQYAKRVVGRKQYGGNSSFMPMKVNSSGVLPLIFAQSIVTFPGLIAQFWPDSWFYLAYNQFMGSSWWYLLLQFVLVLFFTYFYTTISFNPIEISKNIQQYGGMIPGIRQGKPTVDFLSRISRRITLFGALFLALLASLPFLFLKLTGMQFGFGPTSILIACSVAIETARQIEGQLSMRNYKGFLRG